LEQFRLAVDLCVDAYDTEPAPGERLRLASAALLFAQVAEHLERNSSLAHETIARCRSALPLVRDDRLRREIEILLTREMNQSQDVPQSHLAAAE
jgi:hypothetical protein